MLQLKIKELRESRKLSQAALARQLGISQSTVAMWENGENKPKHDKLMKLCEFFGVSASELLGEVNIVSPTSNGAWIPVLGKVQAGIPVEAVQDIIDYEDISNITKDPSDYFALQIKGSSMEPRFCAGDVVIVKKQNTAEDGDIVIALINGDEATVKKFKQRPEGIMLIPMNNNFETMFYSNDEIEKLPISILGKVVELRGKF